LTYIQTRQRQHAERGDTPDATENGGEEGKEGEQAVTKIDWESVDVVGGSLKMGISQ
jgi:vacuolar protein sorting-associated protein 35